MLRYAVWLLLVTGAAAGLLFLLRPEAQRFIDRATIAINRIDNHRHARKGWPLPGTPDLAKFDERLKSKGLELGAPVFIRVFKLESELELWLEKEGRYQLFATYPICLWSGRLGPKVREGDRQSPEGFYAVNKEQLNPNSRWHRSFNLGFPNEFDRAHGRTGSFLMVHGGCLSIGCYAMTNAVVDEIWRLVTEALDKGQPAFQVHAFPFRMTARNLEMRRAYPSSAFWADLKQGYDIFERTRVPPAISVCDGRYVIAAAGETAPACQASASASP
jgi:murein L,D-transpeptidase YafK